MSLSTCLIYVNASNVCWSVTNEKQNIDSLSKTTTTKILTTNTEIKSCQKVINFPFDKGKSNEALKTKKLHKHYVD